MDGDAIQAAALGAAFLTLFFRSVRLKWPENYSTLRGALESYISQGLLRYLCFRTLPVLAVGVFVGVTCRRLDSHPDAGVAAMGALHLASTNGRATVRLVRRRDSGENRTTLLLFYLASSMLVAVACLVAAWAGRHLDGFVPHPADLATAAWTGLFAAVLAVSLQSLGRRDVSDETLLARARNDIGANLWELTARVAVIHETDPALMQAIVAAEALQRPRSLRRLERLGGFLSAAGTYGIAQMRSARPLTDEESVDLLAKSFERYLPERNAYDGIDAERLAYRLEQHNRKKAFVAMVASFYEQLIPTWEGSTAVCYDGRKVIDVAPVARADSEWIVTGTASVRDGTLCWSAWGDAFSDSGVLQLEGKAPARASFTLALPLVARSITLNEAVDDDEELNEERSFTLSL